jgi:hypothetical protein
MPRKPALGPRPAASRGPPPILTHPEQDVVAAYRAMDDETRDATVRMMQSLAEGFPRGPRLRLVSERST